MLCHDPKVTEKPQGKYGDEVLFIINPWFANMDLLSGECRARSACTYMQSDLALHSPLFHFQIGVVIFNYLSIAHYLPLDGVLQMPFYLVWEYWVQNRTSQLSVRNNRYFEIQT